jgi:hypothetical protein
MLDFNSPGALAAAQAPIAASLQVQPAVPIEGASAMEGSLLDANTSS